MIGFEKHVASDRDGWRGLLSEFVNVTDAQQAAAIGKWRVLLSGFLGMRNALQAAVGQPAAIFGTSTEFWMDLQSDYALRRARQEVGPAIAEAVSPRAA
jgi:plasmid maintenance system antidote protein VapI